METEEESEYEESDDESSKTKESDATSAMLAYPVDRILAKDLIQTTMTQTETLLRMKTIVLDAKQVQTVYLLTPTHAIASVDSCRYILKINKNTKKTEMRALPNFLILECFQISDMLP